jgi:patatin-like phospholipase/acyl hydrolase
MTFRLLSCDGGGIRGYLSCLILQGLHDQTGLLDKADGFAGTSTGGLISVALADGRAQGKHMGALIGDLVTIYRTKSKLIFQENAPSLLDKAIDAVLREFGYDGGPGITATQYKASGLEQIAGDLVQDRTLASIPPEIVLAVNTVSLDVNDQVGWQPWTLSNHVLPALAADGTPAIRLADAALATSAAPTYFPPHRIVAGGTDYGYFADGGTFANNPVMNGIEVALASRPKLDLAEIQAVSIGTGLQPMAISEQVVGKPSSWGVLQWFGIASKAPTAALLELALSASADNQTRIAERILGQRMARVNPPLSKKVGIATHTEEAYSLMHDAFEAARQSDGWKAAVGIIDSW